MQRRGRGREHGRGRGREGVCKIVGMIGSKRDAKTFNTQ